MDNKRTRRVEQELKKELSRIISTEIKDPRLGTMTTVTAVEVTSDLRHAKVFISVLGNDKEKEEVLEGLANASGFIKKEISQSMKLRHFPDLHFKLDESIERGMYMGKLISDVMKQDEENRKNHDQED